MNDKDRKTEEATPKKLRDARKKGQIAKSTDLNSAFILFISVLAFVFISKHVYSSTANNLRNALTRNYNMNFYQNNIRVIFMEEIFNYFKVIWPVLLLTMLTGIITNLVQTGFLFSTEPLKPDFKKINPISGFKNLFSQKVIFNLVKNLIKLSIIIFIAYLFINKNIIKIQNIINVQIESIFNIIITLTKEILTQLAIILLVLGIIDYIYQRRDYKKNLRMTKDEIKDEFKDTEGNPQIKSFRQQRQRQLAMSRMMDEVPEASVIITNPTHIAIAVKYDSSISSAPVIIAKGADYIAEKIKEIARKNNIPILENKELARTIYKEVEVGNIIPIKMYQAVAEILAIVYKLQQENKGKI